MIDRLDFDEALEDALLDGIDSCGDGPGTLGDDRVRLGLFGLLSANSRIDVPGEDGGVPPSILLLFLENSPRLLCFLDKLFFDTEVSVTSKPS